MNKTKFLVRTAFAVVLTAAFLCLVGCGKNDHGVPEKNVVTITEANFQTEVLASSQPVLIDFWASWCGPCKIIGPIVAELATEFEGKAKVGKVNVDDEQAIAKQYNISAIPTLLIFKDGKQVDQIVGLRSKAELKEHLSKFVQKDAAETAKPNP